MVDKINPNKIPNNKRRVDDKERKVCLIEKGGFKMIIHEINDPEVTLSERRSIIDINDVKSSLDFLNGDFILSLIIEDKVKRME